MAVHFTYPRATFIHIPKTGGTSFYHWTEENLDNFIIKYKHRDLSGLEKIWGDLGYTFTIVRNPFDRMVSLYHYQKQYIENVDTSVNDFRAWISNINLNQRNPKRLKQKNVWKSTLKNQVDWIDVNKINLIIKFENLDKEFKKLQAMFRCYKPLPKKNSSSHKNYKIYYDTKTKNIIKDIFYKDLELLNYDF